MIVIYYFIIIFQILTKLGDVMIQEFNFIAMLPKEDTNSMNAVLSERAEDK
jgi:hypothetical protein